MPLSDFWIILRWWGSLFLIGAASFPLTKRLFHSWHDSGYFFSKAVGMVVAGWLVLVLSMARVAPFTVSTIMGVVLAVFFVGLLVEYMVSRSQYAGENRSSFFSKILDSKYRIRFLFFEELFFLFALLFWAWVKGHEPSIRGLEKFMDYGFMNSILNSRYLPAVDMWYPPETINYYYFGHLVTALLTKLSGLDLAYTFNLMLATIFAFTLTMSFSIGYQLWVAVSVKRALYAGWITAYLVTLAGNMQTIYAFTRGYSGDAVQPFWKLRWNVQELWEIGGIGELWGKLGEGMNTYWYANATRFIPYSIHEFPSYSFVVSDVHGHVLSIPFVLLAIALLVQLSARHVHETQKTGMVHGFFLIFYGFLCGVLLMTNALDGPIYFGLLVAILVIINKQYPISNWKNIGIAAGAAAVTSLPFLIHFKSFVNGVALNCPPQSVANSKIGILLFEGVEKCQRSPLWMMWILWGFFWFCGIGWMLQKIGRIAKIRHIGHIWNTKFTQLEKILVIIFVFSTLLIIFPEFFYFKDIYPQHFRSNTMFKLGYQAFMLYSIVSAYAIVYITTSAGSVIRRLVRATFILLLVPQLLLVSIYPIFSVRSYFNALQHYEGVYGLTWLASQYPNDYAGILWLNSQRGSPTSPRLRGATQTGLPVLVEADGDSYTDYQRFSVFTGMPTPIGWAVHEWLWRGSYDVVSPRRDHVREIYESPDTVRTRELLDLYHVRYIVVGAIEREKFVNVQEAKFLELGIAVFTQGDTVIYERQTEY